MLLFIKADSKAIIKQMVKKERNELSQIEENILSEKNLQCLPGVLVTKDNACPVNEVCTQKDESIQVYECICPKQEKMRRIDGVCREYLPNQAGCTMYLNECDNEDNEECVAFHSNRAKHGTCQCQIGFRRDFKTFRCMPTNDNDSSEENDKNVGCLLVEIIILISKSQL